ncbi:NADH-quinone oxidoreductase subunit L [Pedobacter sp. P351]|uniref:NADH-quinone oxidoreductase subunit L n=1 Tax=Pedobacter superstes TaxID=3133441 RepID=UPI0030A4C57F
MDTLTDGNLSLLAVSIAVLPLLSFLGILLIPGKRDRGAMISIFAISLSFVLSVFLFIQVWNNDVIHQQVTWFTIGGTVFSVGILLNNLSVLMLLLVTAIALLVHIYSTKYMHGDAYLYRYWAYLSLFCFSMLGLVIADNLLILYMFWELVGFSSYLLIGFWFTKDSASQASKKAFIMNRLGDLGFLTGIMIVFAQFRTLDINLLFSQGGMVLHSVIENGLWINGGNNMPAIWLTIAGLAFFFGATAKSAQFPLHTWLPDAMEGPTSVSSLIHAATMVAAGVFLLARIYPIFDSTVLLVIASIGAFTAFMAATIALTQNDIKRILAFSTISQLGFMMIAMGVGAYASGIFHLVTHAFFKCLLFLAAGAVIHEMAHIKEKSGLDFDHQSIQNMGGLRKKMPVTFITMIIASLALVGLPLTSGYLSKDAILIQSFEWSDIQNNWAKLIPYSALLTSWLTAFYISRLIFKVFFGNLRIEELLPVKLNLHEAPNAMKYVLLVLAVFCLFPAFSLNPLNYDGSWIIEGLSPVNELKPLDIYHTLIPVMVNIIALFVIYLAYNWYARRKNSPDFTQNILFRISDKQWYFNEIYQWTFVSSIISFSKSSYRFDQLVIDGIVNSAGKAGLILSGIIHWIDTYIVDALVNASGSSAKFIGNFTRHFQTGRLQHYLLSMILVVLTFFIIKIFLQAI